MTDKRQNIPSKMEKTSVVLQNRELAKYVPLTRVFTPELLRQMLDRYGMVYVKPDIGSFGNGVMKVEKRGRQYRYQSGTRIYTFAGFPALSQSLRKHIGARRYLIQKGIHVLRHSGRPFDFRVMIQRGPSRRWIPTGIAARVAHPQKAVTNGSQGGTIYLPSAVLLPHIDRTKASGLLRQMNRIATLTAAQLSRTYPALNELGLDIAVDGRQKPWILEVNTHPDPCPFTKLPNKNLIKRIVAYGKAYGRRYNLTCNKAKSAPLSKKR